MNVSSCTQGHMQYFGQSNARMRTPKNQGGLWYLERPTVLEFPFISMVLKYTACTMAFYYITIYIHVDNYSLSYPVKLHLRVLGSHFVFKLLLKHRTIQQNSCCIFLLAIQNNLNSKLSFFFFVGSDSREHKHTVITFIWNMWPQPVNM